MWAGCPRVVGVWPLRTKRRSVSSVTVAPSGSSMTLVFDDGFGQLHPLPGR
eukprot:COSAG01_NODE_2633_length_7333_cov_89.156760_7_plen_51_part_00